MKALTMTLLAMMLSTASARMLKGESCSKDYQPPNYWGKCVHGEYKYVETGSDGTEWGCEALIILVPQDIVGDKTLTIETRGKHGFIRRGLTLNNYGYYAVAFNQDNITGPDVDIAFYLNGIIVHTGSYQQNFCFLESGSIHTNDPNAVTYEGDYSDGMPGHVITRF